MVPCCEMVLRAGRCGTASAGNRLGDHGSVAPHCERGALPPALHWVSAGASLGKLPVSALGRCKGVSHGAGEMLPVSLVTAPSLHRSYCLVEALLDLKVRRKNVLSSLMPTFPLQEILCKLCRNPENHFIVVLICSVQLLSHWLSKVGVPGCHTSAVGDFGKVGADAVESV